MDKTNENKNFIFVERIAKFQAASIRFLLKEITVLPLVRTSYLNLRTESVRITIYFTTIHFKQ